MVDEFDRKFYLKHYGAQCPYCQSGNIRDITGPCLDGGIVDIIVICDSCNKSWTNIYKLHDVREQE